VAVAIVRAKNRKADMVQGEPLDRNKSDLTHRITALSMAYLMNVGFRPVETEVAVAGGWVADVASFCLPTPTETRRLKLRSINRFGFESCEYGEIQFQYGPLLTAIIEVKTTRADFLKDKQRKFSGIFPAHLCYLAYPKDVVEPNELPRGWQGLEMTSTGNMLRRKHWNWPEIHPQHPGEIAEFIAAVALRADNRTKYARNRLIMKMYRAGTLGKGGDGD
jgi:hypothetical protein